VTPPPLVLVHGLWDTPKVFRRLEQELRLRQPQLELLAPHLPHRLGAAPLQALAALLAEAIDGRFGPDQPLDLFGFSMGGVVARLWLVHHGGCRRTRRFTCLGSPQQGTLLAQLAPRPWLSGIADMKIGSPLLRALNNRCDLLESIQCISLFTPTDCMVFPGWNAVLPVGETRALPVFTHRQLIAEPRAIRRVADVVLAP
jgi:triacylglycerol lipase